ncbi:MAG TPA: SMP-30/gluconolactonase/LRE family protein [Actinophytocola sp.]|jgi:sugar lactone lactonase YvrE|nr:SMP-30/gluconolactonase/LRE family protein [Actinophytocola sp.]
MTGALPSHPHVRPQAGEPAPPHRYPLLLAGSGVGLLVLVAGLFTASWLVPAGAALAALGLVAFVAAPSPIKAAGWQPPRAPRVTANRALADAEVLAAGQLAGPEDLALTPDGGTLYATSFGDGRIVRFDLAHGGRMTEHANTGGSPADLALRPDGSLLVCDWSAGLLQVAPDGEVSTLLPLGTPVDGKPFVRPDGVSVAADGTIYLSEGSDRPGCWNGVFEVLEAGAYGRVIAFDPASGRLSTVVSGLSFANGNAIEPGGRYLVVADQYRYRIARLWLSGPDKGRVDTFADNLPGLPHNLHFDADGLLWAGLYQGRNATLDGLSPRPRLKNLLAKLPAAAVAGPDRVRDGKPGRGAVISLDAQGNPVRYLASPPSRVDTVSAVVRHRDRIYVSTLTGDAILRVRLPR